MRAEVRAQVRAERAAEIRITEQGGPRRADEGIMSSTGAVHRPHPNQAALAPPFNPTEAHVGGRVFISYDVASDQEVVGRILSELRVTFPEADVRFATNPIDVQDASASVYDLLSADVCVVMFSREALEEFDEYDSDAFTDFLLELTLVHDLNSRGKLRVVLPIFLGDATRTVSAGREYRLEYSDFFGSGSLPRIQSGLRVPEVCKQALGIINHAEGGPFGDDYTLEATLHGVIGHEGVKLCGHEKPAIDRVISHIGTVAGWGEKEFQSVSLTLYVEDKLDSFMRNKRAATIKQVLATELRREMCSAQVRMVAAKGAQTCAALISTRRCRLQAEVSISGLATFRRAPDHSSYGSKADASVDNDARRGIERHWPRSIDASDIEVAWVRGGSVLMGLLMPEAAAHVLFQLMDLRAEFLLGLGVRSCHLEGRTVPQFLSTDPSACQTTNVGIQSWLHFFRVRGLQAAEFAGRATVTDRVQKMADRKAHSGSAAWTANELGLPDKLGTLPDLPAAQRTLDSSFYVQGFNDAKEIKDRFAGRATGAWRDRIRKAGLVKQEVAPEVAVQERVKAYKSKGFDLLQANSSSPIKPIRSAPQPVGRHAVSHDAKYRAHTTDESPASAVNAIGNVQQEHRFQGILGEIMRSRPQQMELHPLSKGVVLAAKANPASWALQRSIWAPRQDHSGSQSETLLDTHPFAQQALLADWTVSICHYAANPCAPLALRPCTYF